MIETVQTSGKALLSIINDVLDLSKIEAGLMTLETETVETDALCQQALAAVVGTAQNKGLALDVAIDDTVPAHIVADRRRLAQVLINLLGNAVKFTESGSVWLNVDRPDQGTIRFEIADTGPGMSPEQAEHIFRPLQAGRCLLCPPARGRRAWSGPVQGIYRPDGGHYHLAYPARLRVALCR